MLTDFFLIKKNLRVKQIVILKTYYRFEVTVFFFLNGVTLKKFIFLCLTVLGLSCGMHDFRPSLWHVGS